MIICSCNKISHCEVIKCIKSADAPTVSKIFKELGLKPECATCVKTFVALLNEHKIELNTDPIAENN